MSNDVIAIIGAIAAVMSLVISLFRLFDPLKPQSVITKPALTDSRTYWILGVNLLVTLLLPLQLRLEFPATLSEHDRYADYMFYFRHYPHITIYPALFLGFGVLFAVRAVNIYRAFSPPKIVVRRMAVAGALALVVTNGEMTGRNMMLLEFNADAQSQIGRFKDPDIVRKARTVGLDDAVDPAPPLGQQVIGVLSQAPSVSVESTQRMKKLFNNYEAWNTLGVRWQSISRAIYIFVFLYMTFVMLVSFAFLPFLPRTNDRSLEMQNKADACLSLNLLGVFFVFLLWVPFRISCNVHTKIPLFGAENIYDNFFGQLPLTGGWGITSADTLPGIALIVFATFVILRMANSSRRKTVLFFWLWGVLLVVGLAVLAGVNSEAFLAIFGIGADVSGFGSRIVIATLLVLLIFKYVGSIPRELDMRVWKPLRPPKHPKQGRFP